MVESTGYRVLSTRCNGGIGVAAINYPKFCALTVLVVAGLRPCHWRGPKVSAWRGLRTAVAGCGGVGRAAPNGVVRSCTSGWYGQPLTRRPLAAILPVGEGFVWPEALSARWPT